MTTPRTVTSADDAPLIGERALGRGVTVTWWYTFAGILFFGFVAVAQWPLWILASADDDATAWRLLVTAGAALVGLGAIAVLLRRYRPNVLHERDENRRHPIPADSIGLSMAAAAAIALGIATGSWLSGVSMAAFAVSVRPWMHGIRWKVTVALTLLLIALWVVDVRMWGLTPTEAPPFTVPALLSVLLPLLSASSLWWWDIVLELDSARHAESQLAATRERLRLANDVHDLQGHHLQVIALQLELAQRLLSRDPEAAGVEIARARAAVDDARQGTRDLAARFRGVPLPDELENAADLLRSAGLDVQAHVDDGVLDAPADVLGPVVRESVTNVLKHGDGRWAHLSLERLADQWVYRIANDDAGPDDVGWGSGLDGMTERARAAGGDVRVERDAESFELTVSIPAEYRAQAPS
jgi:two-component system sensor histidine kinase DesK